MDLSGVIPRVDSGMHERIWGQNVREEKNMVQPSGIYSFQQNKKTTPNSGVHSDQGHPEYLIICKCSL